MNLIEIGAQHSASSAFKHEQVQPHFVEITPLRAVLAHVTNSENVTQAETGRKCGDGRYEGLDGKLARFGADAGYVLPLLAWNRKYQWGLDTLQIIDSVVDASEGKFSFHSDEGAENRDDLTAIGCGHLANAAMPEYAHLYGLNPDDVVSAVAYMNYLAIEQPDKVEKVILRGQHMEQGVIINTGTETKIRHGVGKDQWFVVGDTKDRRYAHELFGRLRDTLPVLINAELTSQDFQKLLDMQTEATAGILAPNLPVYLVNLDGRIPQVDSAAPFKAV